MSGGFITGPGIPGGGGTFYARQHEPAWELDEEYDSLPYM
jgi:hypothetical protein